MSTNHEIRKEARRVLEGNWGNAVIATVVLFLISYVLNASVTIPLGTNLYASHGCSLLMTVVCLPLSWGYTIYFLNIVREQEVGLKTMFAGYFFKCLGKVLFTMLLKMIYLILWTLLLVVPGIIKSMSYAMTEYILMDNPDIDATDAIHRSRVMMDGHKMKLFLMYLSFIGWAILCLFTLGLGFLLLMPYIHASMAAFYQDLLREEELTKMKAVAEQEIAE